MPVSQQLQTSRLPSTGTQLEEDGSTVTGELGPPATPLPPLCPKDPKNIGKHTRWRSVRWCPSIRWRLIHHLPDPHRGFVSRVWAGAGP